MRFFVRWAIALQLNWAVIWTLPAQTTPVELYWNMESASCNQVSNIQLQVTELIQGNNFGNTEFLSNQVPSVGYNGASGEKNAAIAARSGILSTAQDGSAFFEFTLTPAAGLRLYITGLSFGIRSTATGPQAWNLYQSQDQFSVPMATGTLENNSSWVLTSIDGLQKSTNHSITIRLYGFGGQGSPAINVANWRIDDLRLSGNLVPDDLPVTWRYQKAIAHPTSVWLLWGTEMESPHEGFTIERSVDAQIFKTIGWVKASCSATIHGTHDYTFTDEHPLNSLSFYRIKQTDTDGSIWVSPIFSVDRSVSLLENPIDLIQYNRGVILLSSPNKSIQRVRLKIVDWQGREIRTAAATAWDGMFRVPITPLPTGIYLMVVTNNKLEHRYMSRKFVVIN